MIFGGPRERFTEHEIQQLKTFVKKGGSVLFLVGEGGDEALGTNVNSIIEEYGMTVRQDSVVRTVYYKYLYPKEVFIANGVLQPAVAQNKNINAKSSKNAGTLIAAPIDTSNNGGLNFVFPHGATMNVEKPAVVRSCKTICLLISNRFSSNSMCITRFSILFFSGCSFFRTDFVSAESTYCGRIRMPGSAASRARKREKEKKRLFGFRAASWPCNSSFVVPHFFRRLDRKGGERETRGCYISMVAARERHIHYGGTKSERPQ